MVKLMAKCDRIFTGGAFQEVPKAIYKGFMGKIGK